MDTITHTLFGLALYGTVDKSAMSKPERRALLLTTVVGSQIPDIDVISTLWDTAGRYQMWHRGLTHSVFLVPVWALFIMVCTRLIWKVKGSRWFWTAALAVFIHNTSDLFNAWGTGYWEPFSHLRVTFGTVPIVDFTFWGIMLGSWLAVRYRWLKLPAYRIYRGAWALMALHVILQSAQGYSLYHEAKGRFEQVALSADFIPTRFTVVGKQGNEVVLLKDSLWSKPREAARLESREGADLDKLFAANPKARTLYEWAPFVVVVEDGQKFGIYDPRFYRNGQSFLFEFMEQPR